MILREPEPNQGERWTRQLLRRASRLGIKKATLNSCVMKVKGEEGLRQEVNWMVQDVGRKTGRSQLLLDGSVLLGLALTFI